MGVCNGPIDIVLYWVDGNDPKWNKRKQLAVKKYAATSESFSNIRYESWDNLEYWFRSIEENMPWFNKIIFVTEGHLPSFLDINNPRLLVVKHDEFIPKEYLPTYNSSTIEMNLHRIEALENNYILFNDDTFPLTQFDENYFFKDNKVCDEAIENIITTKAFGPVSNMARYFQVNNMFIINKHFSKREVQKKYPEKWFNELYGERLARTESLRYWNDFPGFYDPHLANAFKKDTLKKIWELEWDILNAASLNKFRAYNDVTQYLVRYWQLCEGDFIPRPTKGKVFFVDINNYNDVANSIRHKTYPMISINENCSAEEFVIIRKNINMALREILTKKSSFEK